MDILKFQENGRIFVFHLNVIVLREITNFPPTEGTNTYIGIIFLI